MVTVKVDQWLLVNSDKGCREQKLNKRMVIE
jgi:hypothetical protein